MGRVQKGAQPRLFRPSVGGDLDKGVGATEHGTDRDRDDVDQAMLFGPVDARIGQIIENGDQVGEGQRVHRGRLASGAMRAQTENRKYRPSLPTLPDSYQLDELRPDWDPPSEDEGYVLAGEVR